MKRAEPLWPLAATLLLFSAICLFTFRNSLSLTGGSFHYPLDDAYIHMAIAKNLTLHGVWGVTRYEFSSASSSPLWTLILAAAFTAAGVREIIPFVLALAVSFALLAWMDFYFRKCGLKPLGRFLALTATLFCAPLPILAFSGMEHPLHALLTLMFASRFCEFAVEKAARRTPAMLCLLAALLCLARYEGLFLVAAACCLLLARRRIAPALAIACSALLPLLAFAIVSMRLGSYPVPNSVLLKAMLQPGMSLGGFARFAFLFAIEAPKSPHLLFLIAMSAILLAYLIEQQRSIWNVPALSLVLFLACAVLHLQFARTGWLYRYEAYLVVFGIYACSIGLNAIRGWSGAFFSRPVPATICGICLVCFGYAFAGRALGSLWLIPRASKNIYDQQYQTALFIRKYYPRTNVVLHDIGAVAFLNDCPIVYVYGLGTIEVARARRSGIFNAQWIDSFARSRNASIAVTYDTWMSLPAPPRSWQDVGAWPIHDNQGGGSDAMHFYAIDSAERDALANRLRSASKTLPPGVEPILPK